MRPTKHLKRSTALAVALLLAPLAAAQTSPDQGPSDQLTAIPVAASTPASAAPVYIPTSLAAEPDLPRTPNGKPDFQSVVWAVNFFPIFESSPLAKSLVVPESEAKQIVATMTAGLLKMPGIDLDPEVESLIGDGDGLPIVRGERRTSLVVLPADGKVPMTAEARKATASSSGAEPAAGSLDGPERRPLGERCLALSGRPPMAMPVAYVRLRFVQTPTHVVIHNEDGDQTRLVPFASKHPPAVSPSWLGDSIARWEGDTLVIETVRAAKQSRVRGFNSFVVNPESTVIERFTRLSGNELLYQFTVEDPKLYTAPWLAEYSFYSADTGMFPSSCHEGNYSLPNILAGQRVADMRSANVVQEN